MMWHWNSLWAPAPGDPPAVDDPLLWTAPWTAEQTMALQTRSWEAMLSASHSWWTMLLSAWPMVPPWPTPGWGIGPTSPAALAGAEPLAAKPPETKKTPAARERTAAASKR